ncbi:MAG: hypothetical protein ACREIT_00105 [Tepidisphaeraceae bacterium]
MNVDPSGNDWTLTSMMVTGGIVGGVIGLTAGATYGTYKSGKFLSWETAEYALIGAVGGGVAGALVGGAVFVGGPIITTGLRQLFLKAIQPAGHTKTEIAALTGFTLGFAAGAIEPDLDVSMWTAIGTATSILTDATVRGAIWHRHAIAKVVGPFFVGFARKVLYQYVQAGTFITVGFAVGFAAGYATGALTRKSYDALFADAAITDPDAPPPLDFADLNFDFENIQLA